ncbi:MAG: nickel-dependent lactate racemase [Candidatus Aminicenantes bacterium]|nr:nickel-dependent lactate racemase [Candidatus Aminicenantes bacterium]
MKEVLLNLGLKKFPVKVPTSTETLAMGKVPLLFNPEQKIRHSLANPIDCPPLRTLVEQKLKADPEAKAVVVISDSTRPVPYSGKSGILYPIIDEMVQAGLKPSQIRVLVATGTHRPMKEEELKDMIDPRVFSLGLEIINHNSRNPEELVSIGKTELGGEILLSRYYVECDLKILTGLVESHFMAGASGGRKSICPGLLAEESTYILHSGPVLASPNARDLVLEGNPVHEEALRVARMAGCDMIVNVTLDSKYRLTEVFSGHLESAHLAAFSKLKSYAAIPFEEEYDLVIGHTGFVGVNHYQAAKGALTCLPLLKEDAICILAGCHTDTDPVGSTNYKRMIRLLSEKGPEKFVETILAPSWSFIPDQWEAQMWARLFRKIAPDNLIYCTSDIPEESFSWIPGRDARTMISDAEDLRDLVEKSIDWAYKKLCLSLGREPLIAYLPDGPYGIPVKEE